MRGDAFFLLCFDFCCFWICGSSWIKTENEIYFLDVLWMGGIRQKSIVQ